MDFAEKSCREFVDVLASKEPVPGGGGASALVGAVGTALGNMVGSLTTGKKKYASVEEDIIRLKKTCDGLQADLLALVKKDADGFAPLAKAYGLPTETEEQRETKAKVLEEASRTACTVPLDIMEACCKAIDAIEEFAAKGSALAISDAGVGALFCKAALQGASLNVFINTKSMKDRACAEDINKKTQDMLDKYTAKAEKVYRDVEGRLR